MAGLQILYHTLSHCHPEQLDWRNIWGCLFSFELWAVEAICRVRLATLKERTSPTRAARQQMKSHPHLSAELEAALSDTLLTCSTCSQNGVESSKIGGKAVPQFVRFSVPFGVIGFHWFSKCNTSRYMLIRATLLFWGFYDPRKWIRECEVAMVKRVKDWSPKMRQWTPVLTPGSWRRDGYCDCLGARINPTGKNWMLWAHAAHAGELHGPFEAWLSGSDPREATKCLAGTPN